MLAKSSKKKKGKQAVAAKTAPKPTPPKAAKVEEIEIPKEERNRMDRRQMLAFVTELRSVKAR